MLCRTDPLQQLIACREEAPLIVVGLMSGTSADGIDAALVAIGGESTQPTVTLSAFDCLPLEHDLRRQILDAARLTVGEVSQLNFALGNAFASTALHVIAKAGLQPKDVHLIGSHGQTVYHQPPPTRSTMQIGEAAVIAERTGIPVISDFRVADVAAGGCGAPLIPLVDYLLCHQSDATIGLLNLGGIGNITIVTPQLSHLMAFDTGPANMLIDAVAHRASNGQSTYDTNGQLAASGQVDDKLLAELLLHPFVSQIPPKSTGRDMFGPQFIDPLLQRYATRLADLAATLTRFTVETIAVALAPYHISKLYVSGGGVHNRLLMNWLTQRLAPLQVANTDALSINPDAKEAIGFALLAYQTLHAQPGNVPQVTGATGPRILGKISLPSGGRPCAC